MPPRSNASGYFVSLGVLIASAVTAVGGVFAAFGGVLSNLVPAIDGAQNDVGVASFVTLIILFLVSLAVRGRLRQEDAVKLVKVGVGALVLTLGVYAAFQITVARYVYLFPAQAAPGREQVKYVAGDWKPNIEPTVGGKSVGQMVGSHGDPFTADGMLWDAESRIAKTLIIRALYAVLAIAMTTTLFVLAVPLWRVAQNEAVARDTVADKPRPKPKRTTKPKTSEGDADDEAQKPS